MPFRAHLLVVANQTVDSPELLAALRRRASEGPIHVTFLSPCAYAQREAVRERVDAAITALTGSGVEATSLVGDADPIVAVHEVWNPGRYDEIVVSTLSAPVSRWMQIDLPHRVARLTDCRVQHVESAPATPAQARPPTPPPAPRPLLESVLSLMRSSTRRGTT